MIRVATVRVADVLCWQKSGGKSPGGKSPGGKCPKLSVKAGVGHLGQIFPTWFGA